MTPYYDHAGITIHQGDCRTVLASLPDGSVNCAVTSPPYFGLRDYGCNGQIGLEESPDAYIAELVKTFREVRRVLRDDGTLWLNLGDSYANDGKWGGHTGDKHVKALHCSPIGRNKRYTGLKPKDLIGIPWRVALALQADGWYLRSDIIWHKPNPMPESVTDRPTRAHEYIFLLSKSQKYYYDSEAIKIDGSGVSGGASFGKVNLEGPGSRRISQEDNARIRGSDKQRGHSRRHAGFNDRWDEMERAEQIGAKVNRRDVWNLPGNNALAEWLSQQPEGDALLQKFLAESENGPDVWTVCPTNFAEAHFATFPPKLIEPCIIAGCPVGGVVLDPFLGAGTTAFVAQHQQRRCVGIELNPEYCAIARRRVAQDVLPFMQGVA